MPAPPRALHALMAQAAIRRSDLDEGRLPDICAKTGKPAAGLLAAKAMAEPNSFKEILPGGRGQNVELPASAPVMRAVNGARKRFIGWIVVSLVLLVVAVATGFKLAYPIVIGLLLGGYFEVTWARNRHWVGARIDGDEIWVLRANPDFCRAAGRIYGKGSSR